MKILDPKARISAQQESVLPAHKRGGFGTDAEEVAKSNYARVLLFKFLNKQYSSEETNPVVGSVSPFPNKQAALQEEAYFRYLDRLKNGIPGSPEDDWKYAEAALANQKYSGVN